MSTHKIIIEKYIEGFRRSDHVQILSCLSEDIVWVLHGYKTLKGKDAINAEIENEDFEGIDDLTNFLFHLLKELLFRKFLDIF
jgi:uncharacterized protein